MGNFSTSPNCLTRYLLKCVSNPNGKNSNPNLISYEDLDKVCFKSQWEKLKHDCLEKVQKKTSVLNPNGKNSNENDNEMECTDEKFQIPMGKTQTKEREKLYFNTTVSNPNGKNLNENQI